MPQLPCSNSYFSDPGLLLPGSAGILKIVNAHAGFSTLTDTGRPFIPLYGLKHDAALNIYVRVPFTENTTFKDIFVQFATEAYNASKNFTQGVTGQATVSPDSKFPDYLYKKLFSSATMLERYMNIYSQVYQFWNGANPLWTEEQLQAAVNNLINNLNLTADKNLYIPNNIYIFKNTDAFMVSWLAWKAANPDLSAFYGIEIYI